VPREPDVRYVVPENLTEEIADAKLALEDLARALGRVSAKVCDDMGIQFDMDDPQVARQVMKMTFDALFQPARGGTRGKSAEGRTGTSQVR
jgi:hypothetical protein